MPEMPSLPPALLLGGLIAAVSLLVAAWPWRSPSPHRLALAWPLATGVAFLAGACVFAERLPLNMEENSDRVLAIFVPCAIGVEALAAFVPTVWIWLLRILLAASATQVLLHGSVTLAAWTWWQSLLWQGGLGLALIINWVLVSRPLELPAQRGFLFGLSLVQVAAGVILMISHYLTGGPLALVLGTAFLGASLASFAWTSTSGMTAAARVGIAGLCALLVSGHFFASLTLLHAAVSFFSPHLYLLAEAALRRRSRPWLRAVAGFVLIALPLAGTAAHAWIQSEQPAASAPPPAAVDTYSADDYKMFEK